MFEEYLTLRKKKMNQTMTVLADCISLEEPIPMDLIDFISNLGSLYELRGTAHRSCKVKERNNNLYNFWHMYKQGSEDLNLDKLVMKFQFLEFINQRCDKMMQEH